MTETFVKFRGMKSTGENVPEIALGDIMTFSGSAECVQIATEKRADGEERPVIGMRVMEVDLGSVSPAPKDEQLPFEDDDDAPLGTDA
ncbi:hypothetical protein [Pseudonocardia sp. 73-21]|uniref:hypothetical protein n=1 Tax=Pseudonocardia sp. 73-21 TaxID=1895809 RepID=UPI00095E89B3|nr:hypothetical protein [Pseudonocardia sp. 73-21]OJY47630.1 MAG: hypothetical protein BGP03_33395 [Pseudonocardia sp. 73-21]